MVDVAELRADRGAFDGAPATAILNLLNFGVILADGEGTVLSANERAERYLLESDGLVEAGGKLAAEIGFEGEALKVRIAAAVHLRQSGAMLLRRSRIARPLILLVEPVEAEAGGDRHALIVIREIGRSSPRIAERARLLFNFSPAESEIVSRVAQGRETSEIAAERNVSINTLRVQVASAMVKVGVHRQAELVSVISSADILD